MLASKKITQRSYTMSLAGDPSVTFPPAVCPGISVLHRVMPTGINVTEQETLTTMRGTNLVWKHFIFQTRLATSFHFRGKNNGTCSFT
jgi:hypothetical protein